MRRTSPSRFALFGGIALSGALVQASGHGIKWAARCDEEFQEHAVLPIECGNATVPLDYLDSASNATIELELLRVPALKQPSKGSVFVHFGGPGPSGREGMVFAAEWLQVVTGQEFDLIGWDQRGTGNTIPVRCYDTPIETATSPIMLANPGVNSSDALQMGRNWALASHYAQDCVDNIKDTHGDKVGTAYTARDLITMIDALGEENLRFIGFSYGTVLGATAAAMFPDRIESMVLDGVHNPHLYWSGFETESVTDVDKTFSAFLELCFERADDCALAQNNTDDDAKSIEAKVLDMIEARKLRPIPFRHEVLGNGLLDQNLIKTFVRPALYDPGFYRPLANMLQHLLADDLDGFLEAYLEYQSLLHPIFTTGPGNDAAGLIPWADKHASIRTSNLDDVMWAFDEFANNSKVSGDLLAFNIHSGAQFHLDSKEQYTAGFHDPISTRKPLLVTGSTYDVATPWVSSENISAAFEGSGLFKHNGHGHGTMKMASLCTMKTLMSYFTEGALPEPGTVCETEHHPWDPPNFEELYPELGYERPNRTGSDRLT